MKANIRGSRPPKFFVLAFSLGLLGPAPGLAQKTPSPKSAGSAISKALQAKPVALSPKAVEMGEKYFLEQLAFDKKKNDLSAQIKHLCLLSQFYANNGNKEKSQAAEKEAFALADKSPLQSQAAYAEAMLSVARLESIDGNYAKSLQEYQKVLSGLSNKMPAASLLRATLELQALYVYTGKYAEAAALKPKLNGLLGKLSLSEVVLRANALEQRGRLEYLLGQYKDSESSLKEALAILKKDGLPHPIDESVILTDLGALYCEQEKLESAQKYLDGALAAQKGIVGNENQLSACAWANLAKLSCKKGDFANAEKCLGLALKLRKADSGPAQLAYARSLCDSGELSRLQGHSSDAEKTLKESLQIYKSQFGEKTKHPDAATARNNLAMVLLEQGKFDEAESMLKEALAAKQESISRTHPDCAVILNNLGFLAEKKQKFAESDKYYQQSQVIISGAFGAEHPAYATLLNNRALLAESMGKNADAEKLQSQAIAIRRKFPLRAADLVSSLNNIAELYLSSGRFGLAETSLLEAKKMSDKAAFSDKKARAMVLGNLALLYDRRQDYKTAEKFYKEAQLASAESYGKNSLEYARALSNLAGLLRVERKFNEAEPLQKESLAIREKLSGTGSLDAAREYSNTGDLYIGQGRLKDADAMLSKAFKIRQAMLGENARDTAVTLSLIGKLRLAEKKFPEAEQALTKALKLQSAILKNNDEKLANTYFTLADLQNAKGKKAAATKYKTEAEQIMKRARSGS